MAYDIEDAVCHHRDGADPAPVLSEAPVGSSAQQREGLVEGFPLLDAGDADVLSLVGERDDTAVAALTVIEGAAVVDRRCKSGV